MDTLSRSDHGERCLTELDLHKHNRLKHLILESLYIENVLLPVQLVKDIKMNLVNMFVQMLGNNDRQNL